MRELELVTEFPKDFLTVDSKTRLQEYKDASCGIFRCPYIADVWDSISYVLHEAPIAWYKLPNDEDINDWLAQIRVSNLDIKKIELDSFNLLLSTDQRVVKKGFAVDLYGKGYEISEEVEEFLFELPYIYVSSRGNIYIIPRDMTKIFYSVNMTKVTEVFSIENYGYTFKDFKINKDSLEEIRKQDESIRLNFSIKNEHSEKKMQIKISSM